MPHRQITTEKLEIQYGNPGQVAVGAIIAAVAAGFVYYATRLPPPRPPLPFNPDVMGYCIFAGIFLFSGIGFLWLGSNKRIELDRHAKRITRRWALLPFYSRAESLAPFTAVQVESTRVGRGGGKWYRVWLTGNAAVMLEFVVSAADARSDAKAIAEFLGLPLNDLSNAGT